MEEKYQETVRVFKAFCDEKRLEILAMLRNGEKCACVLLSQMDISQSTLSYHMKVLCESGVVQSRQEGKWTHYRLDSNGVQAAQWLLHGLLKETDSGKGNDTICS